jgi:hypothetical protein
MMMIVVDSSSSSLPAAACNSAAVEDEKEEEEKEDLSPFPSSHLSTQQKHQNPYQILPSAETAETNETDKNEETETDLLCPAVEKLSRRSKKVAYSRAAKDGSRTTSFSAAFRYTRKRRTADKNKKKKASVNASFLQIVRVCFIEKKFEVFFIF